MPKTTTFSHPITKRRSRTLEFQYFCFVLQKNSVGLNKNGKSVSSPLSFPAPGQAFGLRQLIRLAIHKVSRLFLDTMFATLPVNCPETYTNCSINTCVARQKYLLKNSRQLLIFVIKSKNNRHSQDCMYNESLHSPCL